jgi:hypothetical protein
MFNRYYGVQPGVALVGLGVCVLAGLYFAYWLATHTSLFRTSRLSRLAPYLSVARLLADGFFAAVATASSWRSPSSRSGRNSSCLRSPAHSPRASGWGCVARYSSRSPSGVSPHFRCN